MEHILLIDGTGNFPGLLHQIRFEAIMGLDPVPGTTVRGSELSYNLLQIMKSVPVPAQIIRSGNKDRSGMIIFFLRVHLIKRDAVNRRHILPGRAEKNNLLIVREKLQQLQLYFPCKQGGIQFRD